MSDLKPVILRSYYERMKQLNPYEDEVLTCFKPGAVVLDAGCGTGDHGWGVARRLKPKMKELVGVDIDSDALERNKYLDKRVHASLESVPIDDGYFDLILCATVFEHLEDPINVLKEFCRLLKPGGHAVIITWNLYNFAFLLSAKLPVGLRKKLKSYLFNPEVNEGTFDTYYRCNSRHAFKKNAVESGMLVDNVTLHAMAHSHWQNRFMISGFLAFERMTDISILTGLKGLLVANLVKL